MPIFLLFLMIPILEIAVFIQAGGVIGLGNTLILTVITAILGAMLLKHQGVQTLHKAKHKLAEDQAPLSEMFDGICLFIAGVLLMTPGFITDTLGFMLFFPPFRRFLLNHIKSLPNSMMKSDFHSAQFFHMDHEQKDRKHRTTQHGTQTDIIEGDYKDITKDQDKKT